MTQEEMLARAQQMRSRDLFGKIPQEEMAALPAIQTELQVDVGLDHPVHIYNIVPKAGIPEGCPMFINFHGGGFIKGRQDKDQVFCSKLADTFGALIWDVDYRLAPEFPYPTAVEESYAVTRYAFAHAEALKVDRQRIILLGHSAGGNLVCTVCIKAGETGEFKPHAAVVEFCPLDLATDPAAKPRAEGDMPAEVARTYNAFYCAPEIARTPMASPIFATDKQLAAFPDTLIMSARLDSLCYEDEKFALKLAQAGVAVTCKRFQNSHHGFTINRTDDWRDSTALLMDFVAQHLNS